MRILSSRPSLRLAFGLLLLVSAAPAWAEDPVRTYNAIKRASLKGLESLDVLVLASEVESRCRPLSDEQIETAVETRLQRAGIPLADAPAGYVFVSLATVEPVKGFLCGFVVSVELQQAVRLVRDMDIWTFGMTWHRGGLGVASPGRTGEDLQGLVASLVDEFIGAYLEQNPKR